MPLSSARPLVAVEGIEIATFCINCIDNGCSKRDTVNGEIAVGISLNCIDKFISANFRIIIKSEPIER